MEDNKEKNTEVHYTQIPEKVVSMFQRQIKHELENANVYETLANWCEDTGYSGTAKMFKKQAEDERNHYRIFAKYLIDRKVKVIIPAIPATECTCSEYKDTFIAGLKREKSTTSMISQMYQVAIQEKDYMASELCLAMLKEQTEEEAKFISILDRCTITQDCPSGYLMIDQELGNL